MRTILVVGGGFAGMYAAFAAKRVAAGRFRVEVLSRDPWLTLRPRLYERRPETMRAPLAEALGTLDIGFTVGEVVSIDTAASVVWTNRRERFAYDRLILATGSVMARPPVNGAQHAWAIDDLASATKFDVRLAQLAQMAAPRIAILGGGFTGIELALELRDRLASHGPGASAEAAKIMLIDRSSHPEMALGAEAAPTIRTALKAARIECIVASDLTRMSDHFLLFASGRRVDADAVVCCTGLVAQSLPGSITSLLDSRGRVMADRYLRTPGRPAIFVAGDVVNVLADDEHSVMMSCQHAMTLGKFAGENAARDLAGEELLPYRQENYVTCLSLGRSGAVLTRGWDRSVVVAGDRAKKVKTEINTVRIYPPAGSAEEMLESSRTDQHSRT